MRKTYIAIVIMISILALALVSNVKGEEYFTIINQSNYTNEWVEGHEGEELYRICSMPYGVITNNPYGIVTNDIGIPIVGAYVCTFFRSTVHLNEFGQELGQYVLDLDGNTIESDYPYTYFPLYGNGSCFYVTNTATITWVWDYEPSGEKLIVQGNPYNISTPSMPYGTNYIREWQSSVIHMQVDQYGTNAGVRYECVGYSGTTNGVERDFWVDVTNEVNITWNWEKRNYYLDVQRNDESRGTLNIEDGWLGINSFIGITATKDTAMFDAELWEFGYWSGDVSDSMNGTNTSPLLIIMDKPRTIIANFVRTTPDVPIISNMTVSTTSINFEWIGETNRVYDVECSTNLIDWIMTNSALCTNSFMNFKDTINISKKKFYRLSVY